MPADLAGTGMDEKADNVVTTVMIPVLEEVLHVDVRTVEQGGARVRIGVTEHDEAVERELRQDVLSVERIPVGRVVETAPLVREEGDLTIVPVLEERLVVTRQLVLKEEIHIRRQQKTVPWKETVTLRRETATVEPMPKPGA